MPSKRNNNSNNKRKASNCGTPRKGKKQLNRNPPTSARATRNTPLRPPRELVVDMDDDPRTSNSPDSVARTKRRARRSHERKQQSTLPPIRERSPNRNSNRSTQQAGSPHEDRAAAESMASLQRGTPLFSRAADLLQNRDKKLCVLCNKPVVYLAPISAVCFRCLNPIHKDCPPYGLQVREMYHCCVLCHSLTLKRIDNPSDQSDSQTALASINPATQCIYCQEATCNLVCSMPDCNKVFHLQCRQTVGIGDSRVASYR